MTFHKNNFAGQTVGTDVTVANSSYSGDAFTVVSTGSGTITYATDPTDGDVVAIGLTPADGTSCYVRDASFNSAQIAVSDCFYYSATPSADLLVHQVVTAGGAAASVVVTSNGMLKTEYSGGSTAATATVALVAGHWYRIETQVLSDTSAGTIACQWYVDDGTTQTGSLSTFSLNTRGGAITTVDRGPNGPAATSSYASWYYTNLQAQDGTTTPIGAYGASNQAPVANAGTNQTNVEPYTTVTHSGSGTDGDGTITSYAWTQIAGSPTVVMADANEAMMSYMAPGTLVGTTLTFQLMVTDNNGATDSATVHDTIYPVTERAVIDEAEVPMQIQTISTGSELMYSYTALDDQLVRRDQAGDDFVLGVTKPDAANTGWVPPANPTTITATRTTITTDNAVYQDTIFVGEVWVQAKNVTFRNCWFRGQQTANAITDPLVRCHWNASQNTLFDRCTVGDPNQVGWPDCGILGWNFTANRCDISRSQDGIRNVNSDTPTNLGNITVQGCYIHDLMYLSPYAAQSDNQSHNDCIQLVGGSGIDIIGNTLHAYVDPNLGQASDPNVPLATAGPGPRYAWMTAVILTPNNSAVSDVTIDRNWLEGGMATLNFAQNTYGAAAPGVTVTNNHFGGDDHYAAYDFLVQNSVKPYVTTSGNTFPDGSSVPISNGG